MPISRIQPLYTGVQWTSRASGHLHQAHINRRIIQRHRELVMNVRISFPAKVRSNSSFLGKAGAIPYLFLWPCSALTWKPGRDNMDWRTSESRIILYQHHLLFCRSRPRGVARNDKMLQQAAIPSPTLVSCLSFVAFYSFHSGCYFEH
jgi:hypothetical protein